MVAGTLWAVHRAIGFGHERELLNGSPTVRARQTQMPNIEHLAWTSLHFWPPSSPGNLPSGEEPHFTRNHPARLFRPDDQAPKPKEGHEPKKTEPKGREEGHEVTFDHTQGRPEPLSQIIGG